MLQIEKFFFFVFLVLISVNASQLYSFTASTGADLVQLLTMESTDVDDLKPIGDTYQFFSTRFTSVDVKKNILFMVSLKVNESYGSCLVYLNGFDLKSGEMTFKMKLPFVETYLGISTYGIEVDSHTGLIYVIGQVEFPRDSSYHLLEIDPKKKCSKFLGLISLPVSRDILGTSLDIKNKLILIATTNMIYGHTFDGIQTMIMENPLLMFTLDYNQIDSQVYGIGVNDRYEKVLVKFNTTNEIQTVIGKVGDYPYAHKISAINWDEGYLYVIMGIGSSVYQDYSFLTIEISNGNVRNHNQAFYCCHAFDYINKS